MKSLAVSALMLWVAGVMCQAGTEYADQFDGLVTKISEQLVGGGWQITTDRRSIILVRRGVRLLFDVSLGLPGTSAEEKWNKFSVESDYMVRISFDSELKQEEYDLLTDLKAKMVTDRLRGLDPRTKKYAKTKAVAENLLRLPDYRWQGSSVYIYRSDDGFCEIRPAVIAEQRTRLMALLNRTFSKYATKNSEQAAAPNGGPAKPLGKSDGSDEGRHR